MTEPSAIARQIWDMKYRFKAADGAKGLEAAMEQLFAKASQAIKDGVNILILTDRGIDADNAPIPSLLAVSGLHHHLIREGTRTQCGLVIETGEAREAHHFCLLIGYGAGAVNPYLVFETIADLHRDHRDQQHQPNDDSPRRYRHTGTA